MVQQQAWWRLNRFPLFVAARTLSVVGDFAAAAALTVHLYQETRSGLAISGFFAARIIPRLLGPLGGALSDRFDPRTLLIYCDVAATTFYVAIAWLQPSYFALLGMVLLAESVATVSAPAARTMIAKAIPAESRAKANAVLMMIATISMTAGSGLGGMVSGLGYRYALVINAGTFVASAVLLGMIPLSSASRTALPKRSTLVNSALSGVRALLKDRQLRAVAFATAGTTFAVAVDRPALIVLVEGRLHAGSSMYGFVLGAASLGGLLAAFMALRSKRLAPSLRLFAGAVTLLAIGHLATGASFTLAVLFAATLLAGVAACLRDISGTTLLQGFKSSESLGVVMGTVMSGTFLADAFGSLVGGLLTDAVGPRLTYAVGGSMMLITAALTPWRSASATKRAPGIAPARGRQGPAAG
ncbi:MFS transporter [Streptomyces sp. P1-3]|uniref:MFS transporter n=1 Tax=Streptomyces sp. P1-3 TaxID=3421658 RepID=UPI003D36B980